MRSSNVLVCYVDNAIRHWSMSVKAPRAYLVSQEQRVEVPAIFSQKYIKLQPFICFYKTLAGACGETLSLLEDLKKDHKATLRSEDISRLSFSHTIDLVIIRLVEGSHENIAAGRMYEETFELVNCIQFSLPQQEIIFKRPLTIRQRKGFVWKFSGLLRSQNIRAKSTFNIFFNNHAAALPKRNVSYRVQKKKK
ncbi:hypothetical protein F4703DRAFT_1962182 [Phycomyces blakesleeanus]